MGRFITTGVSEVAFATTLADPAAPTATECNAAVDLTPFLINVPSTPFDGSTSEAGDLSSRFNKTVPGTYGGQEATLTLYRDKVKANDTAWATLPRDTAGYLIVARRGLATKGTYAIGDAVDVWPVEVITRNPGDVARNDTDRFTVSLSVTDEPTEDYDLAA